MSPKRPERQLRWLLAATALPGLAVAVVFWRPTHISPAVALTLLGAASALSLTAAILVTKRLRFWLRTATNLASGLREGDYSFRARGVHPSDVWGELIAELNLLADHLRSERLNAREATGLLRNVMAEIPLAVFTFDPERRLRFVNSAGERALEQPQARLLGRTAAELGLNECLDGPVDRMLDLHFGPTLGRWALRRTTVRQEGHPYQLVVLTDLSRTLRDEERLAWQRIVRVLGHEVNNSLAPIQSIAASLEKLLALRAPDWETDAREGLNVIRARSESLSRFMQSYARLARLPAPAPREVDVADWIQQNAALETRLTPVVHMGPTLTVHADRDQLDQLLINLIRNAVDAALLDGTAPPPQVEISWSVTGSALQVTVVDNGPGLVPSDNLFVPFFTTKSGGSGIGLALCRQIAEGHHGTLTLANNDPAPGAIATLRLPLS